MSIKTKIYIGALIAAAGGLFVGSLATWSSPHWPSLALFVILAMLASLVKLRLPGLDGTYTLNFAFLLFGIIHFPLPQTLIIGCASALVQSFWHARRRPTPVQVLFNMANLTLSVGFCFLVDRVALFPALSRCRPAEMSLVACMYFAVNTVLVSGVLALLQGKHLRELCSTWYVWFFPYYLVGAALVGLIPAPGQSFSSEAILILFPLVYLIHFFVSLIELRKPASAAAGESGESLPAAAKLYLVSVLTAGMVLLIGATLYWHSDNALRFACYLTMAAIAATLKVCLPGMRGTISVNFVLLLVAISDLEFAESVFMGALVGVIQCVWKPKRRPTTLQALFNGACVSLSTAAAFFVCRQALAGALAHSPVALLAVASLILYLCNTLMVSAVLALVSHKPLGNVWKTCYFWSCPYYLVGAVAAGLMTATSHIAGWQMSLAVLPLMAMVYVSYRIHVLQADSALWGS